MTRNRILRNRIFFPVISLIIVSLLLTACNTAPKEQPFDFYTELTTEQDIAELRGKAFISEVFPFTLMIFQRPGYANPMMGQFAILAAPSLDDLNCSPFSRDQLKKEDPEILKDASRHPIIIDESLAKAEKLSVGDVLRQETKKSGVPMEFTVGAIYRHSPLFAQYEAVALIDDQLTSLFGERVDELGFTNAYLKAADVQALKDFLDNDFIPQLPLKGLTPQEIATIPREDLKAYYETYEYHINRMKG